MVARASSAIVGIHLVVLLVWFGFPWFLVLVCLASAIGALELCDMAGQAGRRLPRLVVAAWAVALVVAGHLIADGNAVVPVLLPALGSGALISLALVAWQHRRTGGLLEWGLTAGAALYAGGLLTHAPLLRGLEQGREWVLFLLLATFATDTGAFAVGRAVGRRRLAPSISPGKTWEGALGGLLAALGASVAIVYAFGLDASWGEALTLGALVGVAGQVGDLVESRLKRAAGAKDSGWLIPGHGGVLDRMDSIVFNLVVVYHFVKWAV